MSCVYRLSHLSIHNVTSIVAQSPTIPHAFGLKDKTLTDIFTGWSVMILIEMTYLTGAVTLKVCVCFVSVGVYVCVWERDKVVMFILLNSHTVIIPVLYHSACKWPRHTVAPALTSIQLVNNACRHNHWWPWALMTCMWITHITIMCSHVVGFSHGCVRLVGDHLTSRTSPLCVILPLLSPLSWSLLPLSSTHHCG